jgi:DNA-binding transcriptional regulator YiaG
MSAQEFKRIREELKLTQAALAEQLGISRITLAHWEMTGVHSRPIPLMAEKLLELLRKSSKK